MNLEKQLITKELSRKSPSFLKNNFKPTKNSEYSQVLRKQGNELYLNVGNDVLLREESFNLYSASIRHAECDSEDLAFAYGNRSAILYRMKKYKEAISDIDRSLKISCTDVYQLKLRSRKIDCLNKLGSSKKALEEIETLVNKISKLKNDTISEEVNKIKEKYKNLQKENSVDEKQNVPEHLEILFQQEKKNPFDSISIKRNKKYGRYLIANRDFEAGEIIFVENPFVKVINLKNVHIYCSHCLKTSWSTIPCDYCNWCMFCSEDCKKKAWQEYHDIECMVITDLLANFKCDDLMTRDYQLLTIRSLIIGIKKAGCISSLQQELQAVDNCKDECSKGFKKDNINFGLSSIYTLNDDVSEAHLQKHINSSAAMLLSILKFSSLFEGSNNEAGSKFDTIDDILKNDDILFIGSLILKLCKIIDKNIQQLPGELGGKCKYSNDDQTCHVTKCCSRGSSILVINSLINHSCNPSVKNVITPNQQFIVYSLEPIKQNSQIFITYMTTFYNMKIIQRQTMLKAGFNFDCTCDACENNWPTIQELMDMAMKMPHVFKKLVSPREQEFLLVEDQLVRSIMDYSSFDCSQKTIKILSNALKKTYKNIKQPSIALWKLKSSMQMVFEKLYSNL